MVEEVIRVASENLHVLGGDAIGFGNQFVDGVAEDDFAVVLPSVARDGGGGKPAQQFVDSGGGFGCEFGGVGQQDGRAAGAMLGLSDQVDSGHFGITGFVGDDQRFGWSRQQIDAHAAEQL